ncbi:MAG: PEP-CTERM sorting domain-containing protein [Phycisphaerales bacterium]|nr:PEP-CTERM sorting domain-containing protein [Phycisphaerales bacterium]
MFQQARYFVVAVIISIMATSTVQQANATNPQYQWHQVTASAPFAARDGAGALVYNNKMWLLGGWNPSDATHFPKITNNEVWSSTNGADWTLVKPNTFKDGVYNPATDWEGRHTAGYIVHDNKMYIVGGDANQGHYQNDVWSSTNGSTWTKLTDNVPWGPRVLHHTVEFNNKIWVMGGQTLPQFAAAPETFYRDIWISTDGIAWRQVTPNEPFWPQRGMIGGAAVMNGRLWVLGGGTYDTPNHPRNYFNDVWSTADGIEWTQHTANAPWAPREYHDVAVFNNELWVMEGYDGAGNREDVWHSPDGVNWTELPDTPWAPRHAASVFVHDDALWMVAGNNMTPDVWKLTVVPEPGAAALLGIGGAAVTLRRK